MESLVNQVIDKISCKQLGVQFDELAGYLAEKPRSLTRAQAKEVILEAHKSSEIGSYMFADEETPVLVLVYAKFIDNIEGRPDKSCTDKPVNWGHYENRRACSLILAYLEKKGETSFVDLKWKVLGTSEWPKAALQNVTMKAVKTLHKAGKISKRQTDSGVVYTTVAEETVELEVPDLHPHLVLMSVPDLVGVEIEYESGEHVTLDFGPPKMVSFRPLSSQIVFLDFHNLKRARFRKSGKQKAGKWRTATDLYIYHQ